MIQGQYVNVLDFMTQTQIADVLNRGESENVTAAIQAALDTGKNVYFPAGTYMHTGGVQQIAQGQHIFGDGIQINSPPIPVGNATILKKISGTSFGWQLESHNGGAHNISFDNAGFAGPALKVSGHYLVVENICMGNVGGTDYTMLLESVNTGYFSSINFNGSNYACIGTTGVDPCLYSEFHKVVIGGELNSTTYGVNLSGCNSVSFYDMLCEPPMFIGDNTQNLNFFNFSSENYTNPNVPLITIEGSTLGGEAPTNINFDSARIVGGVAKTSEWIRVKNAKNVNIEDVQWVDLISASPVFCTIDGAQGFTLQNLAAYVNATTDIVNSISPGNFNQAIRFENIYQVNSNQNLYLRFNSAGNLSVVNASTYVTFYNAFAGSRFLFENVSGTIDTTNVPSTVYFQCINCTSVNDVAEVATLSNCLLTNNVFVQSGRVRETSIVLTAAATASWSSVIKSGNVIKAVHTRNTTTITGAGGFTGYSVGYTATGGNNVTAFGSNLSPTDGAGNGIYDYGITSPYYNEDNANRDILLTANGGNFATGTIKLCMIYEDFINGLT